MARIAPDELAGDRSARQGGGPAGTAVARHVSGRKALRAWLAPRCQFPLGRVTGHAHDYPARRGPSPSFSGDYAPARPNLKENSAAGRLNRASHGAPRATALALGTLRR